MKIQKKYAYLFLVGILAIISSVAMGIVGPEQDASSAPYPLWFKGLMGFSLFSMFLFTVSFIAIYWRDVWQNAKKQADDSRLYKTPYDF